MDNSFTNILFNIEEGIGTIILNRPNRLNALNYPLIGEVIEALETCQNEESLRVIVIKGNGRSFCSGDDLKGMGSDQFPFKEDKNGERLPHQKMIRLIRKLPIPVIALLHGHCLGAGFELALACDFRLANENLEIGDHRVTRSIGVLCGASWFLPRIVGFARATEIILTGRHLNAKEAYNIGLVTEFYPSDIFNEKSKDFINKIARLPTKCLGFNKQMLNFSLEHDLFPSIQNELDLFIKNTVTKDSVEGLKSFLEKRDPNFTGN